jgi:hypothetical protein
VRGQQVELGPQRLVGLAPERPTNELTATCEQAKDYSIVNDFKFFLFKKKNNKFMVSQHKRAPQDQKRHQWRDEAGSVRRPHAVPIVASFELAQKIASHVYRKSVYKTCRKRRKTNLIN